jgi:hypothetical protein
MQSVNDTLPAVKGRTSRHILFITEGQRYAGYYHNDGWFYSKEKGQMMVSAFGPNADTSSVTDAKAATEWEYLREEDVRPLSEFTLRLQKEAAQLTSFFTVGDVVSERCASLDILTPMHQSRFHKLSEGEQILLYSIIERLANHSVGSLLKGTDVPVNARQATRSHVSSVLANLRKKTSS